MAKNSKDSSLGCLFTLIFLPFIFLIAIIKDLVVLCVKRNTNKNKSKSEMDDLEFDEMNDVLDEKDSENR